ncbi:hypothetical protein JHW43_004785 [Diplocarpon mali]|nr:hypothetical protein JHW43_004785 [Diplocarpon mali]
MQADAAPESEDDGCWCLDSRVSLAWGWRLGPDSIFFGPPPHAPSCAAIEISPRVRFANCSSRSLGVVIDLPLALVRSDHRFARTATQLLAPLGWMAGRARGWMDSMSATRGSPCATRSHLDQWALI